MAESEIGPVHYGRLFQPTKESERGKYPKFVVFNTGDTTVSEFYRVIKTCLDVTWSSGITKVTRIVNGRTPPRLIIQVRPDMAEMFRKSLRETFRERNPRLRTLLSQGFRNNKLKASMVGKWRTEEWKPYSVRKKSSRVEETVGSDWDTFASWNINGFNSKRLAVGAFLVENKVAVACLQETLHTTAWSPLRIQGYYSFSINRQKGFRGQAILVKNGIPAYRIPHEDSQILHVKISQWKTGRGNFPLHVFSCYWPSGGNRAGERKVLYKKLCQLADEIAKAEENPMILMAGDFNEPYDKVVRRFGYSTVMDVREMRGSRLTRFPKSGPVKDLDHFITSAHLKEYTKKSRVIRNQDASD
ncbi:DNase I-like protein, partial [Pleurotus eryngii]